MNLPLLKNADVNGKTVFLRADLDVPLSAEKIEDDTRLLATIPTIEYLLKQNAKIIIGGHLGRPKGIDESLSLKPVAEWFAKKLIHNSEFIIQNSKLASFGGWEIGQNIFLLENPKRPMVVIIGGKKIETKLPLVEEMHRIADYVLVGGKIAKESQVFLKVRHEKISGKKAVLLVADLTPDELSITEKSLYNFLDIILLGKTIIWNGTMGFIGEKEDKFQATKKIAKAIIASKAYSIVGGGDTVEFLNRIGILNKFSFVSTGGGAMLAFLSGEKFPGLVALEKT